MHRIETTEEIQRIALQILRYLDEVCREHGLTYFIVDGTLLGAVRHRGFIPWDDDVDVWLPREDYDRLEKIVNSDTAQPYRIWNYRNTKNYYQAYGKLVDTRTRLIERSIPPMETGVFVDLFPCDGLPPEGTTEHERHLDRLLFLESQRINAFRTYRESLGGGKGSLAKRCKWLIRKCYGGKRILRDMDRESRRFPVAGASQVACLCGGYRRSDLMPAEAVLSVIRMPFESITVNAPAGYDRYLRTLYGDYRKLPPKEEQVRRHPSDAWWLAGDEEEP